MKLLRPCVQFIDMLVVIDCIVNMKQVDLVLFGHVHNYERTCSVFQNECKAMPTKYKKLRLKKKKNRPFEYSKFNEKIIEVGA